MPIRISIKKRSFKWVVRLQILLWYHYKQDVRSIKNSHSLRSSSLPLQCWPGLCQAQKSQCIAPHPPQTHTSCMQPSELLLLLDYLLLVTASEVAHKSYEACLLQRKGQLESSEPFSQTKQLQCRKAKCCRRTCHGGLTELGESKNCCQVKHHSALNSRSISRSFTSYFSLPIVSNSNEVWLNRSWKNHVKKIHPYTLKYYNISFSNTVLIFN